MLSNFVKFSRLCRNINFRMRRLQGEYTVRQILAEQYLDDFLTKQMVLSHKLFDIKFNSITTKNYSLMPLISSSQPTEALYSISMIFEKSRFCSKRTRERNPGKNVLAMGLL